MIHVPFEIDCPTCDGTGRGFGEECHICDGSGVLARPEPDDNYDGPVVA